MTYAHLFYLVVSSIAIISFAIALARLITAHRRMNAWLAQERQRRIDRLTGGRP